MISVKVIADSVGPNNVRLTSLVLTYPRFMHAEFMTHRAFSRNASSSRAIPVLKQIDMVRQNPAVPMVFTGNKPGMQGGEPLTDQEAARRIWLEASRSACDFALALSMLNLHKQYANRPLEPFAHITVVVTATDWDNFFALRWHKDALPEMQELAKQIWYAMEASQPRLLQPGMMHLPFVTDDEYVRALAQIPPYALGLFCTNPADTHDQLIEYWMPLIKRSVARCARVSYLKHDGSKAGPNEDEALYDKLATSQPLHASPTEHQAMCLGREIPHYVGNLLGWGQFRKTLPNENATFFLDEDLQSSDKTATVPEGENHAEDQQKH